MKIRINGNSVRMRLNPEEVEELVKKGAVKDTCTFPTAVFSYGIQSSQGHEIEAKFEHNTVRILIPEETLNDWDKDSRVGFEQSTAEGLFILIEKDFQCLHPRKHEKEEHLYPNPSVSK